MVKPNLFLALKRLRQPTQGRIVWVDALCIDQDNVKEKIHQVAMMGDIYRSSSRVLIWLGEHALDEDNWEIIESVPIVYGHSINWADMAEYYPEFLYDERVHDGLNPFASAFALLALLAQDSHITRLPVFPADHFKKELSEKERRKAEALVGINAVGGEGGGPLDIDQFEAWKAAAGALLLMMTRAYWTRVWIIQEAVLGQDPIVHFGEHAAPLSMFTLAERNLRKHFHGCCSKWGSNALGAKWSKLTGVLEEFAILRGFDALRLKVQSSGVMSLFDVITNLPSEREATDPRDHIYGLLGLVNDTGAEKLLPDYNLAISEAYTQATFNMIMGKGDLSPLVLADNQRYESLELTSWVPDWTAMTPDNPMPYDWRLFQASGFRLVSARLEGASVLTVRGLVVDQVSQVGSRMAWQYLPVRHMLDRIVEWRIILRSSIDAQQMYLGTGSVNHAFWRTVFGDALVSEDGENCRMSLDDLETISCWWRWFVDFAKAGREDGEWGLTPHPERYQKIFRSFLERTRSRSFFLTENHRIGMGVAIVNTLDRSHESLRCEVQAGDLICLLFGSNLPIVLRKIDQPTIPTDSSTESAPMYTYIGSCYVHGIMDGEALATTRSEDSFVDLHIGGSRRFEPETGADSQSQYFEELPSRLQFVIAEVFGYGNDTKAERAKK